MVNRTKQTKTRTTLKNVTVRGLSDLRWLETKQMRGHWAPEENAGSPQPPPELPRSLSFTLGEGWVLRQWDQASVEVCRELPPQASHLTQFIKCQNQASDNPGIVLNSSGHLTHLEE